MENGPEIKMYFLFNHGDFPASYVSFWEGNKTTSYICTYEQWYPSPSRPHDGISTPNSKKHLSLKPKSHFLVVSFTKNPPPCWKNLCCMYHYWIELLDHYLDCIIELYHYWIIIIELYHYWIIIIELYHYLLYIILKQREFTCIPRPRKKALSRESMGRKGFPENLPPYEWLMFMGSLSR